MKKLALATVFAAAATTSFAGGYSEPVAEPVIETIVQEASSSSSNGLIIPLVLIALVAVAAS